MATFFHSADPEDQPKRKPGRQPGSDGFLRPDQPESQTMEHHYPQQCIICLQGLDEPAKPYMGPYTYELETYITHLIL